MTDALLFEWYRELPQLQAGDDPEMWTSKMHNALRHFRRRVRIRYSEGTLQRMLEHPAVGVRRATVLALGLTGTFQSNADLAKRLHDEDELVAKTASDSLWEIWFRGDNDEACLELQRAVHLPDQHQVMACIDEVIREWPEFAEPYNQRAIVHFARGDYQKSITDCETTLRLNPFHFGAQAGIGQCHMKTRKYSLALRAFQLALDINPHLEYLEQTVEALKGVVEEG